MPSRAGPFSSPLLLPGRRGNTDAPLPSPPVPPACPLQTATEAEHLHAEFAVRTLLKARGGPSDWAGPGAPLQRVVDLVAHAARPGAHGALTSGEGA